MAIDNFRAVLRARRRLVHVESQILEQHLHWEAQLYADWVVRGRWRVAESLIMRNAYAAARYAEHAFRHRWKEAETVIVQDARAAFYYATYVVRDRWKAAEPLISQSDYAKRYATFVLPDRWDKQVAKMCSCWLYYYAKDVVGGKLPDDLERLMLGERLRDPNDPWANRYFSAEKYTKKRRTKKSTLPPPPSKPA